MPNVAHETGIKDDPWERIRKAMCIINRDRLAIRRAERRIEDATLEISYVLWPRTEPNGPYCRQCGAGPNQYCMHRK